MRVAFERSGGIAGMRVAATVDTDTLPPDQAKELQDLVEAADFFNLPAKMGDASEGADRFQYRVTIESGGQRHTVEADESSAPDALQPLLRRLTVLARSSRG